MKVIVVDTSVFVSALLKAETSPRQVLRLCLRGDVLPLMSNPLMSEYEALLSRTQLFRNSLLNGDERQGLMNGLMSICKWVPIYYLWRPNLPDEADNHLIELAVAGGASHIVTGNLKDLKGGELKFPGVKIVSANGYLKERSDQYGYNDNSSS